MLREQDAGGGVGGGKGIAYEGDRFGPGERVESERPDCRYVARPALAGGRLRILDADHLSFALKTPWSDGTSHLLLSPMELLEKLAALVPPPRFHLLRYQGVLAIRARTRDRIVPAKPVAEPSAADGAASAASCGHRLRWRPCCPQRSLRPRIDPDTGRQATKLYCELGRRIGKTILRGVA